MKNYIVMLVLACVSMSLYAVNPIKEGNMIAGHVIVKGTEESIPFATVMILVPNPNNDIRGQPWCGIQ